MPRLKHLVTLTAEERAQLTSLIRTGTTSVHVQTHARILLKADSGPAGPACDDATIAAAVEVSWPTVERVRKAFATRGLDAAVHRKAWIGPSRRNLDGAQEAQLVALACSSPLPGVKRLRRFYGSATLSDPNRLASRSKDIADAILQHLTSLVGTSVRMTADLMCRAPALPRLLVPLVISRRRRFRRHQSRWRVHPPGCASAPIPARSGAPQQHLS